jgi:hypothetical protein
MVSKRTYQHCQRLVHSLLGPSRAILRIRHRRYCALSHRPASQSSIHLSGREVEDLGGSRSPLICPPCYGWVMTYLEFEFDHKVGGAQWHPIPQPPALRRLILSQSYMLIRVLPSVTDRHSLHCGMEHLSHSSIVRLTMIVVPPKSHHLFCRSLST